MIANAGIPGICPCIELSDEEFLNVFNVNVFGVFTCYRTAAKQMIDQGAALTDSTGYRMIGASYCAHYTASKMAVRGITQIFAMDLAQYNIKVNCYAPGIVKTTMWALIDDKLGKTQGKTPGESFKQLVAGTALGSKQCTKRRCESRGRVSLRQK
jgi:NAD(P)-dependent dehydrogenase (short-subunit alcohol dehydrogenase family)